MTLRFQVTRRRDAFRRGSFLAAVARFLAADPSPADARKQADAAFKPATIATRGSFIASWPSIAMTMPSSSVTTSGAASRLSNVWPAKTRSTRFAKR